jgi:peptide/nickel transport system ATP-binding protein/oligopeptide transport system ATP-binding protein
MTGKALPLLEVTDLQTTFSMGRRSDVVAVDGVSFAVGAGETLAIVGESGSGKSVTSLSIMRLLPAGVGRVSRGSIQLRGRELTTLSEAEMRAVRGKDIGMIFQEPMTSLNPVHTIGHQIAEVVMRHEGLPRRTAHERSVDLLQLVGIPEPDVGGHATAGHDRDGAGLRAEPAHRGRTHHGARCDHPGADP